jgi:hypothetical protein
LQATGNAEDPVAVAASDKKKSTDKAATIVNEETTKEAKNETIKKEGGGEDAEEEEEEEEEDDLPLSVQQDLLSTLGALRALIQTYRFESPSSSSSSSYSSAPEPQLQFSRRLAVHQLERSMSSVLKSLEELQVQKSARSAAITIAGAAAGSDTAGYQARKATLRQLRTILKPMLSREFLQLEAAPVLQKLSSSNKAVLHSLQGLAAELTEAFGGALAAFLKKKVKVLEDKVINQLEIFAHVIVEHNGEHFPVSNTATVASTSAATSIAGAGGGGGGAAAPPSAGTAAAAAAAAAAAGGNPTTQLPPVLANITQVTTKDIMVTLAQEKAAVDRKIKRLREEGSASWDGTDKMLVELVLLEEANALWKALQENVQLCVSSGLFAMLDLAGGGLSHYPDAGAGAGSGNGIGTADAQQPSSSSSTAPPPTPAPAASRGYFY